MCAPALLAFSIPHLLNHLSKFVLTRFLSDFLSLFPCEEDVGEVCVSDFLDLFSEASSDTSVLRFFVESEIEVL